MEDDEFESLKRMMDEAERKDAIAQKLDSVSKLQVGLGFKAKTLRLVEQLEEGLHTIDVSSALCHPFR